MDKNFLNIKKTNFIDLVLRLMDSIMLTLVGMTVYHLYVGEYPYLIYYKVAFLFSFLLSLIVFPNFDLYSSWRGRGVFQQAYAVIVASATVFILMLLLSVALKATINYSRVWFFLWAIFGSLTLVIVRELLFVFIRILRKKGWNLKNVVIVGDLKNNDYICNHIKSAGWTGFNVVKIFSKNNIIETTQDWKENELKKIIECIQEQEVVEIWMTYSLKETQVINQLLYMTRNMPQIKCRYIPSFTDFQLLFNNRVSEIAGIVTMDLNHTTIEGFNLFLKKLEDLILGFFIFLFISPIMALIAIAIRLESKGPVLFKQSRHGWGGKPINVYKFRTMYVNDCGKEFVQATKNDPRVTKVGAFLRKTSLDELPQFYNVLQGRMSIVGPRPHAIAMNKQYMDLVENYFTRNKVKPGITGWAQINGWRGETDTLEKMTKRVEYDLYYISNWSLWFDIKIIILTIFKGFTGKNAY